MWFVQLASPKLNTELNPNVPCTVTQATSDPQTKH